MSPGVGKPEIYSISEYIEKRMDGSDAEIINYTHNPMSNVSYFYLVGYIILFVLFGFSVYLFVLGFVYITEDNNIFNWVHFIIAGFLVGGVITSIYYYFKLSPEEEVYLISSDRVCKFYVNDKFNEPFNHAGLKGKNRYYEYEEKGEIYESVRFDNIDRIVEESNGIRVVSEKQVREMTFKRHPELRFKSYNSKEVRINSSEVAEEVKRKRLVTSI